MKNRAQRLTKPSRKSRRQNSTQLVESFQKQEVYRKSNDLLVKDIEPMNGRQKLVFDAFHKNHLVLNGSAGTGKTFIATYNALKYMRSHPEIEKIIFVRPLTQTHDIGFLPGGISGTDNGKLEPFMDTYKSIINDLCGKGAWDALLGTKIEFLCTSFLRGVTLDNAIVILDEAQNATFHELDTVITRMGKNTKFVICGDYKQSDLVKSGDKNGILHFLKIVGNIKLFKTVTFTSEDIVRSGLVKDYIIQKEMYLSLRNHLAKKTES